MRKKIMLFHSNLTSKNVNFAVHTFMGLTGFDSGQKRCVSMPGFGLLARKSQYPN